MKLPPIDAKELAYKLRVSADTMITIDGDRDFMNTSRLTCGQVQEAFGLMLLAADKLDGLR